MSRIRSIHPGLWKEASRTAFLPHLYVIQEGEAGPCKVGIARNAFWRMSDLQSGNPRQLHMRAVFEADDRRAVVIAEAAALSHFAQYHVSGEWLDVTPNVLAGFLQEEFSSGAD